MSQVGTFRGPLHQLPDGARPCGLQRGPLAPVPVYVARAAERLDVRQVEGIAALVERPDVVRFQPTGAATLAATVGVTLEYLAADRLPLRTRRRESAHPSGSCLSTGTQLSEMV